MSFRSISFDAKVLDELKRGISSLPSDADYSPFFELCTRLVEGREPHELGEQIDPNAPLSKIMTIFIWECSKNAPRDSTVMNEILMKLGLPENFVSSFMTFYRINKRRFTVLKDSLALSAPRYRDMAWRLDMDIGRRSIANIADPTFMLRLDLAGVSEGTDGPILRVFDNSNTSAATASASSASGPSPSVANSSIQYSISQSNDHNITSLIFQADYANMKHMQSELQRALQELGDTHAERIAKYIS